jgi:hypothetical protein
MPQSGEELAGRIAEFEAFVKELPDGCQVAADSLLLKETLDKLNEWVAFQRQYRREQPDSNRGPSLRRESPQQCEHLWDAVKTGGAEILLNPQALDALRRPDLERCDDTLRRSLLVAFLESRPKETRIASDHLLLGVLHSDHLMYRKVQSRLNLQTLRARIQQRVAEAAPATVRGEAGWTDEAMRVLSYASSIAERHGDGQISCEHLLLGFLLGESCHASAILREIGIDIRGMRNLLSDAGVVRWRRECLLCGKVQVASKLRRDLFPKTAVDRMVPDWIDESSPSSPAA